MPCSTVSQALTILLIGVAIAPGILAAPTPTLPRSFDRQGSLSGDQTQGVDMLQSRRVDYANIGPQQVCLIHKLVSTLESCNCFPGCC
ncbi:hypothetical protein C8R42DRAFT_473487 [Lentinula raphanica]|nr:hypothetical protein C8R42DRAFT_473487 [Lentinula raphanica]